VVGRPQVNQSRRHQIDRRCGASSRSTIGTACDGTACDGTACYGTTGYGTTGTITYRRTHRARSGRVIPDS
jgi:hypothetical protein